MALIDRVQERMTTDLLAKLTNPDEPETSTVDTTYLQQACDDVEDGEFEAYMGEDYDETIVLHVLAAVLLVRLRLIEQGGAPGSATEKMIERLEKRVSKYKNIRSRDRIAPKSSSQLTPTPEVEGSEIKRPGFDDKFFSDLIPEDSSQGDSTNDLD